MSAAIFIKSFPGDAAWLSWCLKSINLYAIGFSETVVAWPVDAPREPELIDRARLVNVIERGNSYLGQQTIKLQADLYTDASFITYLDSDCVLAREFRPEELFRDGKPMLLTRRWDAVGDAACWKEPTERVLGQEATHETMACHPMIYRRETLKAFRDFVRFRHGVEAADYILSQRSFSEFNALGNFVLQHERELYTIVECGPEDGYPRPVRQFWSHSGITPEILAELERLVPAP